MPLAPSLVIPRPIAPCPKYLVLCPSASVSRSMHLALCELSKIDAPLKERWLADAIPWRMFESCSTAVIGPCLGAPAACAATEPFIAGGCKHLILAGTAGGIGAGMFLGDIIFPRDALSEEGTSKLYGAESQNIPAGESKFRAKLERAISSALTEAAPESSVREQTVWTTDAPYRETAEKVRHFRDSGAGAVEMEYAALLQISQQAEIGFAAAFVVSDLLAETWQPGFGKPQVKQNLELVCREIARFVHDGHRNNPVT